MKLAPENKVEITTDMCQKDDKDEQEEVLIGLDIGMIIAAHNTYTLHANDTAGSPLYFDDCPQQYDYQKHNTPLKPSKGKHNV